MGKTIIKLGNVEIEKQIFHQHKRAVSIKSIYINKIVVSSMFSYRKKGFKYFIGYKGAKKWDLYVYFFQPWVYIEETLMKLNECLF